MTGAPTLAVHLARIGREIARAPLPEAVAAKARLCLLDHLAALLYGLRSPMAAVGDDALAALGAGRATVVGRGAAASPHGAAFFHGLVATAEDLDDSHRFAGGLHLGAVTFPAALALSEGRASSGEDLLRAVVAGYEVAGRLARSIDAGLRARGWHATGAVGPLGAAAAAALVLDLDEDTTAGALGIAASGAGGLFAFLPEGASVRHAHGAWAAANGLLAATLAAAGMTGPRRVLEGRDGYLAAFSETADLAILAAPSPAVSGAHEILSAYHKVFACCGHALPAITAALALRDDLGPRPGAIAGIEARLYRASAALANPAPRTVEEAKFSLPVLVGIALVHGDVSRRAMTMANIGDPRVREVADRVRLIEDPAIAAAFPRLRAAELVVTLKDGSERRRRVEAALGMPENPVGWAEIEAKFRDAAEGILDPGQAGRLAAAVEGIGRAPTTAGLMALLGGAGVAAG